MVDSFLSKTASSAASFPKTGQSSYSSEKVLVRAYIFLSLCLKRISGLFRNLENIQG